MAYAARNLYSLYGLRLTVTSAPSESNILTASALLSFAAKWRAVCPDGCRYSCGCQWYNVRVREQHLDWVKDLHFKKNRPSESFKLNDHLNDH